MKKYEFDVRIPSEPAAGIAGGTETVEVRVKSGDPGGEPGEFEVEIIKFLREWYDTKWVYQIVNRCQKCGIGTLIDQILCTECAMTNPPFTLEQLEYLKITKRQAAEILQLEEGYDSFDYTLPQIWLDWFAKIVACSKPEITYNLISSTTFWCYSKSTGVVGLPVSICIEVQKKIEEINNWKRVL